MLDKQKIGIAVAIVLLAVVGFWYYKKRKDEQDATDAANRMRSRYYTPQSTARIVANPTTQTATNGVFTSYLQQTADGSVQRKPLVLVR